MEPQSLRVAQVGDVARVAIALTRALGSDCRVIRIALRQPGARLAGPLKVLALPLRIAELVLASVRVRRLRPDVVHIHWVPNGLIGILAGRPWVIHCHGDDIRALSWPRRPLFHWILGRATVVVVSTPDLLDWIPRKFEPRYVPTPIPPFERMDVPEDRDVLVASAAYPGKGTAVAFAAIERLRSLRPGLKAAGISGPLFPPVAAQLPMMPHANFLRELARSRVVLGQFEIGSLGVADLEAMALGRPVVTFVEKGRYVSPPPVISTTDPETIAARVAELLDDPRRRNEIGKACRAWVTETHSDAAVRRTLLALYGRARQ